METPYLDEIIEVGEGGIPTTELWEEIRDNLGGGGGGTSTGAKGSVTLNSTDGVVATFSDQGTTGYDILFSVLHSATAGAVGEVTFEIIDATSFRVYNTGSDTTSTLRYWVVPPALNSVRGTATLAGEVGVLVTLAVDMLTEEYDVFTWVTKHANTGTTGEISVEIMSSTQFVVFNTGSDTESQINYWAVTR
jgi:hypothetical protein